MQRDAMGDQNGLSPAHSSASSCSYALRPLVSDIELSVNGGSSENVQITCVELCGDNLYIGTSEAEIIHFVSIPADPNDDSQLPTYIFASRLQPPHNASNRDTSIAPGGIQQILVLPKVQKACVLCNGTLSFYSLPELSPAFNNTTVANCTWVGGLDLDGTDVVEEQGTVVMICVKNKVRLVKIADEVRRIKDIQYPGCLTSTRRGAFACVADAQGYALLDLEHQQKISLFPISSLNENSATGRVEDVSGGNDPSLSRSASTSSRTTGVDDAQNKGHGRSTSLGALVNAATKRQSSPHNANQASSGVSTPDTQPRDASPLQSPGHGKSGSNPETGQLLQPPTPNKPLPAIPPRSDSLRNAPKKLEQLLLPLVCSPSSTEFLLATGTTPSEPGVGLFVNLDGDVVRGTIEFSQYPSGLVVEVPPSSSENGMATSTDDKAPGYVLATMTKPVDGKETHGVEIQKLDVDHADKEWLNVPPHVGQDSKPEGLRWLRPGLRTIDTTLALADPTIGATLRVARLPLSFPTVNLYQNDNEFEKARNKEEAEFGRRLGGQNSRLLLWSGNSIWCMVRVALVARLDAALDQALNSTDQASDNTTAVDRSAVVRVISSIRGQEPETETEFLSLEYIRQKASFILFADILVNSSLASNLSTADLRITENLLMESGLDPRVLIMLMPELRDEVVQGKKGIWVHAGLIRTAKLFSTSKGKAFKDLDPSLIRLIKQYLNAWRQRKGFGSVADEEQVFHTVDAALLRILLMQEDGVKSLPHRASSERSELYAFVDSGVDCFDRAVQILEANDRLFVLSRLYQSRRMARKVLDTWRRIIEGERDQDNGLADGENEIRKYLINVRDTALVDEYGTWLAARNPALGVQVFTNEVSKVKWEPHQVVLLLRRRAPDAVKEYLEHLVFGKKFTKYANDLISYYLDNVLHVLAESEKARAQLAQTYSLYRALHPPKPTYREYITQNALPDEWWHDRLRLLSLLGGSHGSDFSYDVSAVLARIEPFEESLVPESIILDGQQGRHQQALRHLTHGLGDYHTAVNYCLLGGASIFHPSQSSPDRPIQREEQVKLFNYLLLEFLRIDPPQDRLERTADLLARFPGYFNIQTILTLIPESWSVDTLAEFLVSALRVLLSARTESGVVKALSGAENLQINHELVEKIGLLEPTVDDGKDGGGDRGRKTSV